MKYHVELTHIEYIAFRLVLIILTVGIVWLVILGVKSLGEETRIIEQVTRLLESKTFVEVQN